MKTQTSGNVGVSFFCFYDGRYLWKSFGDDICFSMKIIIHLRNGNKYEFYQ